MPNNQRRSKTGINRQVNRLVSRRLHSQRLTAPPTWYKTNNRHREPGEIPNSPPYAIKLRVIGQSKADSPLQITPFSLAGEYTTTFSHITINRIDIWGSVNDNTISVIPYRQLGSTIAEDRPFYGTGTANSRRPYVTISICNKDAISQPLNATAQPVVDIRSFDSTGIQIADNYVVDLWCVLTSSSSQIIGLANTVRFIRSNPEPVSDASRPTSA